MTFQEAAIESSKIYYNYLDDHNGGLIEYNVIGIRQVNKFYYLKLAQKIQTLEYLQFKINANIFNDEQIKPLKFNLENRELKVAPKIHVTEYLETVKPENIKVVIDLKFLIKNVQSFYEKHQHKFTFLGKTNDVIYSKHPLLIEKLSEEQCCAVNNAISHPLSYIWGAPGTGKTRYVLTHCVLAYLQSFINPKILIAAPTNNAVENTLFAILPILKQCGYNLEEVFRLGTASVEFATTYPMCCENSEIDKQAELLHNSIKETEKEIFETKKQLNLYPEYLVAKKFEADLTNCEQKIYPILKELHKLFDDYFMLQNDKSICDVSLKLNNSEIKKLTGIKRDKVNLLKDLNIKHEKYNSYLLQKIFKKRYTTLTIQLENALKELNALESKIKSINEKIENTVEQIDNYTAMMSEIENQIKQKANAIKLLTSFWNKLNNISDISIYHNIESSEANIKKQIEIGKEALLKRKERYSIIADKTQKEVLEELKKLEVELIDFNKEYDNLLLKTSSTRMSKCKILASTVDTILRRIQPSGEFKPTHIFLDEAGYCSLIKGVALLAYQCPITMLGDHMQLPPVCEMDDGKLTGKNKTVTLWAQSAIYIEDINLEPYAIFERYLKHVQPSFNYLVKYDLNCTYRFDNKLAKILASYVYTNSFHSAIGSGTDICYIYSPKINQSKPRLSKTECENIIKYLINHSNENIGIITPYKAQRELLIKEIKKSNLHSFLDSVYTVHGSQGKEFNTVLFSVVDTTNKWFTNSLLDISNGKCVVNTAVSRAKNKLILVCDVKHWKEQPRQLIGRLLEIATEIKV